MYQFKDLSVSIIGDTSVPSNFSVSSNWASLAKDPSLLFGVTCKDMLSARVSSLKSKARGCVAQANTGLESSKKKVEVEYRKTVSGVVCTAVVETREAVMNRGLGQVYQKRHKA